MRKVALTLLAGLFFFGCAQEPGRSLVDVPYPELSGLDDAIRHELETARDATNTIVGDSAGPAHEQGAAWGEMGMRYHAHGLRNAAQSCYLNASTLVPEDYRWHYYAARIYAEAGASARAIERYNRALELRPDDLPTLLHLAEAHFDTNELGQARQLFDRALVMAPDSVHALTGLGHVASARREFATAVEHFEHVLELAPGNTEVYYPLGLAYRGLGDNEKALGLLEKRGSIGNRVDDPLMDAVDAFRGGWRGHQDQGSLYFDEGLYDLALGEFRKAAELAPRESIVRANLGSTLVRLGDYEAAREELDQAIRLDPGSVQALFNLGTLEARLGDDHSAVELYRSGLAGDPERLDIHLNLANALRRLGDFDQAARHYRKVVEGHPSSAPARLGEALALIRLHRYAEAAARLEDSVGAIPEHVELRHLLARLLAAAPDDEVRDGARAAAMADELMLEDNALYQIVLGAMAAAEVGNFERAVNLQRRAIEAVRQARRTDLLPELERNLALYQTRRPCRVPWEDEDPMLSPKSRTRPQTAGNRPLR